MRFDLALPTPALSARLARDDVASLLAKLLASRSARSRSDLGRATGLSRTTVDAGVQSLLDLHVIRIAGLQEAAGRGRPAEVLELAPDFGVVLVADCGATIARLGVFDLGQNLLAGRDLDLRMDAGPEAVLETIASTFRELLRRTGAEGRSRTVIVGLPGPVDYRGGTLVRPPIMPGWDNYPVVAALEMALDCTARIENDVNLRALGEARAVPPTRGPVLYVKVGTGIGVGIVGVDGSLMRGADGAAGDVGHVRVPGEDAACSCGGRGCLEAVSSIRAIGLALGLVDVPEAELIAGVVDRLRRQDPATLRVVRERAAHVGEVMVSLIHFFNPERIVIGGMLAMASDDLLATARSVAYRRALPLATRNLTIARPSLDDRSGLAGGLSLGIESSLQADVLASSWRG